MKRLMLVAGGLTAGLFGAIVLRDAVADHTAPLVVVHWANSHPMRPGLLPQMAEAFNDGNHRTSSGKRIEIVLAECDSDVQTRDLASRVHGAGRAEDGCEDGDGNAAGDPIIVTPQSADWLVEVDRRAGREVIDLQATENIAETWLGIVTYQEMAECLGWPQRNLGYEEILALVGDEKGWEAYPDCSRSSWGRKPLLAFTNPNTSTSGRNVLVSLYAMAAHKTPADLSIVDLERPEVIDFVKKFQGLVDHYMPGTVPLNTKIAQGMKYGHFFLMPEDNVVSLYNGTEKAFAADGTSQPAGPIDDLVMIYPKEGSVLNSNPAGIVQAPWVSPEQTDAAEAWVDYLREDDRQRDFMQAGFRPATGTGLQVDERQFETWGLNAAEPATTIRPGDLKPEVLDQIISSWSSVRKPAIVTFVVDVSGSMAGPPLADVQEGLKKLLDGLSSTDDPANENKVGLLTFSSKVQTEIPPVSLRTSKYDVFDAINGMEAAGETALYDAVTRAVELTDAVAGDPRATRAVIVLSDGVATSGSCLSEVVSMSSVHEVPIVDFCGGEGDRAVDTDGNDVALADVVGDSLAVTHEHDVQVFFLGFGDADIDIGRILAQATHAEYRQVSDDDDLALVIEALSGYF